MLIGTMIAGPVSVSGAAITVTSDAREVATAMSQDPTLIAGAGFETQPANPISAAIATDASSYGGMPTDGVTYGLLSTGDPRFLALPNTAANTGAELGGSAVRGGSERDVTILRIDISVPAEANCLTNLDFRFYSEEYPEYVGSGFNDAFVAELDTSTWSVSGNEISAERNFAFDPEGNPITVNAAGVSSMTASDAAGTTFDGATPLLRAATPITPGPHAIYLSIFDVGDEAFDSLVVVDNIQVGRVANIARDCKPGATVVDDRAYVAIGDSYSSGFGVGNYFQGTHEDSGDNNCQRSRDAYSDGVRAHFGLDLRFHACQGAVTKDLYEPRNATWGEGPQLDHLSESTGLVTLSIGGNDAKFAEVLAECILGFELLPFNTCHNDDKVRVPVSTALKRLGGATSTPEEVRPYDQIFKDIRVRAPYATRVAVGYPEFYPENGSDRTFLPGGRCEGVKKADQRWMVEQIRKLNAIKAAAARRNGFRFADASSRFDGHELCTGDEEWIFPLLSDGRIHPTAAGHDAMGEEVLERLADDNEEGGAYTVRQDEVVTGNFVVTLAQRLLSVIAQWPGSDVPLTLISPSGERYERSSLGAGVTHSNGPTWEQFEIRDPEAGTWTFELLGADVTPGGEPVTVLPVTEPAPNAPPVAKISFVDNGNGTLTFSSQSSTDEDGQIVRREWFVAHSPLDEVITEGMTVTVAPENVDKNITLVVTDDRDETAFDSVGLPAGAFPPPAGQQALVLTGGGGGHVGSPLAPGSGPVTRPPAADRIAPRITKVQTERRTRRGSRTTWRSTTQLAGAVRLRLTLSEAARIRVTLTAARAGTGNASKQPSRSLSRVVTGRQGTNTIQLGSLMKGIRRGKATLTIAATDRAGNSTRTTISRRR